MTVETGKSSNQDDSEKLENHYRKRVTEPLIALLSAPGVYRTQRQSQNWNLYDLLHREKIVLFTVEFSWEWHRELEIWR